MSDWSRPPARHPGVIGEVVEDELVLLLPHAGSVIVLNAVGRTIWELIDGQHDIPALTAALCAEYEVSPDQARADLLAFLDDMAARGLLSN